MLSHLIHLLLHVQEEFGQPNFLNNADTIRASKNTHCIIFYRCCTMVKFYVLFCLLGNISNRIRKAKWRIWKAEISGIVLVIGISRQIFPFCACVVTMHIERILCSSVTNVSIYLLPREPLMLLWMVPWCSTGSVLLTDCLLKYTVEGRGGGVSVSSGEAEKLPLSN